MWMKSVSKFVSKFSQNYEFKATDKPRFGKNVSSVICLHKIEYLINVPSRAVITSYYKYWFAVG
jgi:hypothetical protein